MKWIDSHCHLEMIEMDSETILKKASEAGVGYCITIGTDHNSNIKVLDYVQDSKIYGTLGIHPHEAKNAEEEHFQFIKNNAKHLDKIVAIGECGFDFHYQNSSEPKQKEVFIRQLDIAVELNLPVVIHTREAEQATMEVLLPYMEKGITAIFHSFTSSKILAEFGIKHQIYFSFNGISTFPKAQEVREIISMVPMDKILLETDSPYLSPVPLRGKLNHPANVSIVGKYIADYLSIEEEELSKITIKNTQTLFDKIPLV